jgi:hypothetical protein
LAALNSLATQSAERSSAARPSRVDEDNLAGGAPAAYEPVEKPLGIADGGGQADALDLAAGECVEASQHREQMPATIVASEGVDLVDDHRLDAAE